MIARRMLLLALAALSYACGNSSTFTPYLDFLGREGGRGIMAGTSTATVGGAFFNRTTVVFWNGSPQATAYVSDTQLTVTFDVGLTDNPTEAELTARSDGTPFSAPMKVQVIGPKMIPTAVTPQQVALGAPDTVITVTGGDFRATDVLTWNGAPLATKVQSPTTLQATVPAALLAVPGDGFIQVTDPACTKAFLCTPVSAALAIPVGTSNRRTLSGGFDIAWDANHSMMLLAAEGDWGQGLIVALDPVSGNRVGVFGDMFGDYPREPVRRQLAISDQDEVVYAFMPSSGPFSSYSSAAPLRLSLPALTSPATLTGVPMQTFFDGDPISQSLAVAPGAAMSVAIVANGTVVIVDGTAVRQKTVLAGGVQSLEWGFDSSTLYGADFQIPRLIRFDVDATGITSSTVLGSTPFASGRLHFDRTTRRIYGDVGQNVDEQGGDSRPFVIRTTSTRGCVATIDSESGKAFFSCNDSLLGLFVQSFDLASQKPIASIRLDGYLQIEGYPKLGYVERMVRWGTDGLAVSVLGQLYLYNGPFVH